MGLVNEHTLAFSSSINYAGNGPPTPNDYNAQAYCKLGLKIVPKLFHAKLIFFFLCIHFLDKCAMCKLSKSVHLCNHGTHLKTNHKVEAQTTT